MLWKLARLSWNGALRAILLDRFPFIIGSSPDCDLQEEQPAVSLYHCRINKRNGVLNIEDMGSFTGTYVNGTRVRNPFVLKLNDIIDFGSTWKVMALPEQIQLVREEGRSKALLTALASRIDRLNQRPSTIGVSHV